MYILTRHNHVIDYCSGGYLCMGCYVICQDKNKTFYDCMIVDIGNKPIPDDLLINDYLYIEGNFTLVGPKAVTSVNGNAPNNAGNVTIPNMKGATSSAAGAAGLVPAPASGKQTSFLRGDGTWVVPTDTKYTHPTSGVTAGTYKSVTVNAQGHVTGGSNPTTLAGYGITDGVKKTGDTTTGKITLKSASLDNLPQVFRSDGTMFAGVRFQNTNGYLGSIGMTGAANSVAQRLGSDGNLYPILDSSNYNNYAPTKTGGGASGTWGINISGNAAKDSAGQQINTTYIKGLSASNATLTYTKGNGTTGTVTVNNVATATDADKLDGYHYTDIINNAKASVSSGVMGVPNWRGLIIIDSFNSVAYTVPSNGYIMFAYTSGSYSDLSGCLINNNMVFSAFMAPVKKGDIVKGLNISLTTKQRAVFVPCN